MILYETIIIISYMINNHIALILSTAFFLYILLNKKENIHIKILKVLILSMPLFSISIIGSELHHVFSWTHIFLLTYTILLIYDLFKKRYKLNKGFKLISLFFILLFVQCFMNNYILENLVELSQVLAMMIPIVLTYYAKDCLKKELSDEFIKNIKVYIETAILSTAISVLVEYLLFNVFDINIGNISFHGKRIIYDCIFKGYSVLSMFLAAGMIIYAYNYIIKKDKLYIFKFLIILLSIFLNSSRTGLVASAIVISFIILQHCFKNRKINKKNMWRLFIFGISTLIVLYLLFIIRGDAALFSSSGREKTYEYAWEKITSDIKIFLLGNGISFENYKYTIPHNFLLQTWLSNGIVVLLAVLCMLYKLLKNIEDNPMRYVLLSIIIGALFTTDIYANTFFTIFAICGLIYNLKLGDDSNEK